MASSAPITADIARQLFHYDPTTGHIHRLLKTGQISARRADAQQRNGYGYVEFKGRCLSAHRLAWLLFHGVWPTGMLDHINRNKRDNRAINLRIVTAAQNAQNTAERKDNVSGRRGVCWHKRTKTWQVRIRAEGKFMFVGQYACFDDAVKARDAAEKAYHPFLA